MPSLRSKIIRLAYENPGPLRDAVLPLLRMAYSEKEQQSAVSKAEYILGDAVRGVFSGSRGKVSIQGSKEKPLFSYRTLSFFLWPENGAEIEVWLVPLGYEKNGEPDLNWIIRGNFFWDGIIPMRRLSRQELVSQLWKLVHKSDEAM